MSLGPPVLHALAWTGELSGAIRSMEESLAALRTSGVDARAWLAVSSEDGAPEAVRRLERRGIPVTVRQARVWLAPRAITGLRRSIAALGRGAVLHTHGERALLWGRAAARLAGSAHVHTQHGFVSEDARGARRVRVAKQLVGGVSALVAVHESTSGGLSHARVIPNCLDAASFREEAQDREAVRAELGLEPQTPCCLFMGRLSPEKGADLLAVLQGQLQVRSKTARLFVAGTGPLALGASVISALTLLGGRSDAASLLGAADVLLMPSRSEGLPMVALEAAAMATPVVSFPAGGLADSGLAACVPVGDPDALIKRALALVADPELRAERLQLSATRLADRFGPAAHSQALLSLYKTL
jgi:glycosyltransferase involved in cell wall biosynthesis